MPKTVADYEDAVRRITNAEVDPDSTTREDVLADLGGANAPQVTREVARGIADAVVTEDRVLEAIEGSGELPSEAEIDAIAAVSDDYDQSDRVQAVAREVSGRIATVEEVEAAVRERQSQGGPTFREQVETAVDELASRQEFVGESPDAVASEKAREIGAPRETEFKRAQVQTVGGADQVTPKELGVSDRTTAVSVVTDSSGNTIGVVGGYNESDRRGVAEQLGAERVYDNIGDVQDSMTLEQGNGEAHLMLDGRRIREVSVE